MPAIYLTGGLIRPRSTWSKNRAERKTKSLAGGILRKGGFFGTFLERLVAVECLHGFSEGSAQGSLL